MIAKAAVHVALTNGLGQCFEEIEAMPGAFPQKCSERTIRFLKQSGAGVSLWRDKWARACGAAFMRLAQQRAGISSRVVPCAEKPENL
jgi:hypothetical protein